MTSPDPGGEAASRQGIDPASTVGGQAVIEGVMMRAPAAWSVAVRRPDGVIESIRNELPRLSTRSLAARIPFVRGIMVLGESLTLGFRALSWSAQKAVDEEEEEPLTSRQIAGSMAIALTFFMAIFILIPAFVARFTSGDSALLFNVIEGVVRLALFVGYIWAIGRSKEIARVFEFHGAEHMTIHAYEAGEPLTLESVARYRPEHPRCGTSFLLIVVLASIVFFSLIHQEGILYLVVSRLAGIPLIAGFAYELLRFSGLGRYPWLSRVLAAPGLWLQKLTTGVPAPDQIEVAIASMVTALEDHQVAEVVSRGSVPESALAARRGSLAT
ncbi:MAG TPA: DUF1385 domain-containing protein [Acidimicrobiia bacterium]|nr:DUF1385 domain-containing protein [Acidimicrobiia bacterium]